MSICLPNLRSTSVFKVYYGGTGQTSLTEGGVVIGNGTDAVRCITGSEGQVLTWDSEQNTWVAKDPTGGTGGGTGGSVPDIVIAPQNNTPTEIRKYKFSNISNSREIMKNKHPLIDWTNSSSGSFRICAYNPNRKYLSVYNDSNDDLYISLSEDENPNIQIDFENINDIDDLRIKYNYVSSSIERELFNYSYSDLQNHYSYHTHSNNPSTKLGYGKNVVLTTCNSITSIYLNLTPDFYSNNLNINLDNEVSTGSFTIFLSNSSGIRSSTKFNLTSSYTDEKYQNLKYSIYTKVSSSSEFISSSLNTSSVQSENINGFDFYHLGEFSRKETPPDDFSYAISAGESLLISDSDAVLTMFGYFKEPKNVTEIKARVTEAI